jgi:hypothetical protein
MKTKKSLFALILFFFSIQLYAQKHIGTWELTTIRVLDSKGKILEEINYQEEARQVKVLTPTHFMFISERVDSIDKQKTHFWRSVAGTYQLQGNKYNEYFNYSSRKEDKHGQKSEDMFIRVEDNKLIQSGTGIDEKLGKLTWEEIYQKIDLPSQDKQNVGTWENIADSTRTLRILTPTHHFQIATTKDGTKLLQAVGGTYTKKGDLITATFLYGQESIKKMKTEVTAKVVGDKLITSGTAYNLEDGNVVNSWTDTFYRVGQKTAKTVSTK